MSDTNIDGRVQTGPCVDCSTPATRDLSLFDSDDNIDSRFARILVNLPLRCDECDARIVAEREAEEADREARHAETQHYLRVKGSELPSALLRVDLDRLDQAHCADAVAAARYWALRGGGLMLTGPFGTGKTTIAAGALRLALERRHGRWTSAPLLMARLGSGLGSDERDRTLRMLTGTTALVIDDLDKTRPTEYGAEQIFLAVDGAVTSDRALLITTNLGLGQLAAKWPPPFGEAIVSRLAGYCNVVEVGGPDRRLA